MTTNFSILFFGFLLGMRHATEADHLTAIFTLITQRGALSQGLKLGVAWGAGHTLTLALLGGAVLVLGKTIPANFAQGLEAIVGVMLLLLGFDVLRRLYKDDASLNNYLRRPKHIQLRMIASSKKLHNNAPLSLSLHSKKIPARALLIGMVHGLAGSSALILISLEHASTVSAGFIYIVMFGMGSILGMGILSLAIAFPAYVTATRWNYAYRNFSIAAGLTSAAMGVNIIYQSGLNLSQPF
ncbi:MAG: urease accessory protein [Methylotenera sp.]|jgi:cytochrome c biogenesis protein CcdA|nr:MAG: urease accessory protein [Methylotenera sp.]